LKSASWRPRHPLGRALLAAIALCASALAAAPPSPWIAVNPDGKGFTLKPWNRAFTPWGFNYDHDEAGRLLEDYWQREWPKVEADFQEMRDLGANVVRVHLQYGRFMDATNQPNAAALARLGRLLTLARRNGLRLDLTGLGCYHKADVPAWYDALTEPQRWQAQAAFWEAIARTCASNSAVFCYDLMNEPVVAGAPRKPGDWLGPPFAGKHFVQFVTLDPAGREPASIARDWIRTLTAAIRKHDRRSLITVGLVDWSLERPGLRSGFVPERVAAELDFLSVHLYPKQGKVTEALETLRGFSAGKPVVIEETFPLEAPMPEFTEFMDRSRGVASGWLGFYWGRTPADLSGARGIGDVLTRQWLEFFLSRPQPVMPGHSTRRVEGWTVFVNDKLQAEQKERVDRAVALIAAQLRAIVQVVPPEPLARLCSVPLWISPEYPRTRPTAEYHPSPHWLRENGRNPAMAKAVEFTNLRILDEEVKRMPMLALHELAHAYHDQFLGFDDAAIEAAFRRARDSGSYEAVKRAFADGSHKVERAYAMNDAKEYFAECTEAFFGRNDFFPFTRDELERHDPEMFRLLQSIWTSEPAAQHSEP